MDGTLGILSVRWFRAAIVSIEMVKSERAGRGPGSAGGNAPAARLVDDPVGRAVQDWDRERPDLDTRALEIFARLGRTHRLATNEIEQALAGFDLTISSMDVLLALRRAGAPYRLAPSDLASTSLLTSGGITFRLDRAEEAGLIRRVPSTEDRRVVWAELTEAGLALADEVVAAHIANEERLLEALDEADVTALRAILARLEASITSASRAD